MRATSA
ncbi:hypothetical protein D020_2413A, partial [Vibrio parahaemolyticus SBR10290]